MLEKDFDQALFELDGVARRLQRLVAHTRGYIGADAIRDAIEAARRRKKEDFEHTVPAFVWHTDEAWEADGPHLSDAAALPPESIAVPARGPLNRIA